MTALGLTCARAIADNGRGSQPSSASLLLDASTSANKLGPSLWSVFFCCTKEISIYGHHAQCVQARCCLNKELHGRIYTWSSADTLSRSTYSESDLEQTSKAESTTAMSPKEIIVPPSTPMPKGYGFLPKGIRYKTLHGRKLTHDAGKTLYIVVGSRKQQLGLRVPNFILHQVHRQAKETLPARRAAVEKRDAASLDAAATELEDQFPEMPEKEKALVLKHGFRKYSRRVGRSGTIPLSRKVLLAVIAHVRHRHTRYDTLLASGVERTAARKAVNRKIENILQDWGYVEGRNRWRARQS